MEKAKAFGKSLLKRAAGGSDLSDDEGSRRRRETKPSYCEVVSGSPGRRSEKDERRQVSVKTRVNNGGNGSGSLGDSSGMMKSPQRLFSAEDVAKLIELARNQLKKEKASESGWTQVESKETKRLEKRYAQKLVDEHQQSPESEPRCWQCNKTGHISSSCPRGERCFNCNSSGHKRAECPLKKRATAAEKGKGKMVVEDDWEQRRIRSGGPLIIKEQREVEYRRQENKIQGKENRKEGGLPDREEGTHHARGESRPTARGDNVASSKNRSQMEKTIPLDLKNKGINEKRNNATKAVFLAKSEGSMKELAALRATGGVVMKANGNPSIKDFVDALKNMCSSYKEWNWKPIPIRQGILLQFPSLGGLELLAKRSVIPCKNGYFTVK